MSSEAPVERYLRRPELAERIGVHVSTIDRWVRQGMPSIVWGARSRRFLLSRVEGWADANGYETGDVVNLNERRRAR